MSKKVPDWDPSHVSYLTGMAQHVHGPTDFDDEVQKHLDRLYAKDPKDPLGSPDDDQGAQEEHQYQAIQNISEGSPANVLSPPKSKPLPSMGPPS